MELQELILNGNPEKVGKHLFSEGIKAALKKNFKVSTEFFKKGLDILTCDCPIGNWLQPVSDHLDEVFNEISIEQADIRDYYFTKAFILRYYGQAEPYTDTKKHTKPQYIYMALDSAEKYLSIEKDEYGLYLKGWILSWLKEYSKSLEYYSEARKISKTSRILYKIGRTKETHLKTLSLQELYEALLLNPSSACCARVLKEHSFKRNVKLEIKDSDDKKMTSELIDDFNEKKEWWKFYETYLKAYCEDFGYSKTHTRPHANFRNFLQVLSSNEARFKLLTKEYVPTSKTNNKPSRRVRPTYRTGNTVDEEAAIMSAIQNGEGDRIGY